METFYYTIFTFPFTEDFCIKLNVKSQPENTFFFLLLIIFKFFIRFTFKSISMARWRDMNAKTKLQKKYWMNRMNKLLNSLSSYILFFTQNTV